MAAGLSSAGTSARSDSFEAESPQKPCWRRMNQGAGLRSVPIAPSLLVSRSWPVDLAKHRASPGPRASTPARRRGSCRVVGAPAGRFQSDSVKSRAADMTWRSRSSLRASAGERSSRCGFMPMNHARATSSLSHS